MAYVGTVSTTRILFRILLIAGITSAAAQRVGITIAYYEVADCSGTPKYSSYKPAPPAGSSPPFLPEYCNTPAGACTDCYGWTGSCPSISSAVMMYHNPATGRTEREGLEYHFMTATCSGPKGDRSSYWSAQIDADWSVPACHKCETIFGGDMCSEGVRAIRFSCGDNTGGTRRGRRGLLKAASPAAASKRGS